MEILGRTVEAIRYHNTPILNAYVNQLPKDCRRNREPDYKCIDNCEGRLVIARFMEKTLFSTKAVVPIELNVHPQIPKLRDVKDLPDLERIAQWQGYELRSVNKGKMLYFRRQPVAGYNPCGFSTDPKLFSPEVTEMIRQLTARVDELYKIAQSKPLEALLEDKALAAQLNNPLVLKAMSAMFGQEGTKLVTLLRNAQAKRN